jgi:hypothetical protein
MRRLLIERLFQRGVRKESGAKENTERTRAASKASERPVAKVEKDAARDSRVEDVPAKATEESRKPGLHKHWIWPAGLAIAGIGGAATLLLRGCWHTHMSWPMTVDHEFSYQVCTSCGIKRLYDERTFEAYGPYGYDVEELIEREQAWRAKRVKREEERRGRMEKKRGE